MQAAGAQAELFFWLTVEGYRVTAQHQLMVMESWQKDEKQQPGTTKGLLKAAALGVYEQYLSDKVGETFKSLLCVFAPSPTDPSTLRQASPRVQVDMVLVTKLGEKLQKDDPTPEIFDEIQKKVVKQ